MKMDVDKLPFVVLLIFFSLIGISGNILTLIVYNRKSTTLSKKTFINILAVLDLFVCLTVIPYSIFLEFRLVRNLFMCHFMEFIRNFSVIASNVTLVCIAGERYIAVSRPMKIPSTKIKNIIMAALFLVLCVPFAIPSGLTFTINTIDLCGNRTLTNKTTVECTLEICEYTTTILTFNGVRIYKFMQLIFFIAGILLTITFYALVYRILYLRDKQKRMRIQHFGPKKTVKRKQAFELPVLVRKTNTAKQQIQQCGPFFGGQKIDARNKGIEEKLAEYEKSSNDKCEDDLTGHGIQMVETVGIQTVKYNSQTGQGSEKELEEPSTSKQDVFQIHGPSHPNCRQLNTMVFEQENVQIMDVEETVTDNWVRHTEKLSKVLVSNSKVVKPDSIPQSSKLIQRKTYTMLFVCTVIFLFSWVPFWMDIFGLTNSLFVRYLFFTGHATNPIVYGIVNDEVRKRLLGLFPCRK